MHPEFEVSSSCIINSTLATFKPCLQRLLPNLLWLIRNLMHEKRKCHGASACPSRRRLSGLAIGSRGLFPPLDFSSAGPLAMGIAPACCDLSSVGAPHRGGLHLPAARCHLHCRCSSSGWGQHSRSPWAMQLAARCHPPSPSRPSIDPACELLVKAHVANVYFKCFRCFKGILQVFHIDLVKVDPDVLYFAMVVHVRCKRLFVMFYLFFRCILQVFYFDLQMFHIYAASILS
jgi:hypothetical protein